MKDCICGFDPEEIRYRRYSASVSSLACQAELGRSKRKKIASLTVLEVALLCADAVGVGQACVVGDRGNCLSSKLSGLILPLPQHIQASVAATSYVRLLAPPHVVACKGTTI